MCLLNFLEMEVARWLESYVLGVFLMLLLTPCVSLLSEDLNFCSGKDWLKPGPDKTWPNTQFSHLWSGGDNGHAVSSWWSVRGMHGWLACVWLFETWQSFLFLLGCLKWFPSVPEFPTPKSSVKEGTAETGSMCSLFRSYLYLITSKLPLLANPQSNYPPDWKRFRWFSVSCRLSPLLCLWPCCAPTRIHLPGLWNLKVLFTICLFQEPPLPTRWDQAFDFPVLPMHVLLLV